MKSRIAVPDLLHAKPLFHGLGKDDSLFEPIVDSPAQNSIKLSGRLEEIRSAFLSPIDYARHGADYCILPGICSSSVQPTGTIQLMIKAQQRNIERVAIDIRYTSEIILAKIILEEKYRNLPAAQGKLQFIPYQGNSVPALEKADAVLVVHSSLPKELHVSDTFVIDLVEEWNDLTDLPYVHGFWVGREEELGDGEAHELILAQQQGMLMRDKIAEDCARRQDLSIQSAKDYLNKFSYSLGEKEEESLQEFITYAYYHGVLGDIPDLQFFDLAGSQETIN